MKAYLMGRGLWSKEQDAALYADYSAAALEAFRKAEAEGELKPEDLVKHTYKEIPAHLREQYEEYVRFLEGEVE
jgi:TPP-dependent pyruvate/acetoin dehydrogenase alpha subunit